MSAKDHWIYESEACQFCGQRECPCEEPNEELDKAITELENGWTYDPRYQG